jgi:Aspartyl protease
MRAAAASAFNQTVDAERLLRVVIRSQPRSDTANRAHELLSRIYLRSGQYKRLIDNLDAWARAFPAREEVQRERSDIEQFRGLPDQVNGPRRRSTLRHAGDIFVPVQVNGKPASYFFDTGAWVSVMSQAEATRVGLETRGGSGALADSSGRGVQIRMGVAKALVLGSMRFRDVSFAVLPDQERSAGSPPESGGILGMPILLGAGVIRWSHDGTVEFGGSGDVLNDDRRNLVFYRNRLLLRTSVLARPVFVTLDTGAVTTDLNGNFSAEFAELITRVGTKDTQSITGVGGTSTVEATRLPEVVFQIGTTSAALRPAIVTDQRTGPLGGDCCVANVGLDLLMQGRGFTIDFSRMTLRLD